MDQQQQVKEAVDGIEALARKIAREEIEKAFELLEDEFGRLGGRKGAISVEEVRVAVSDALFRYKRLS